MKTNFVYVVRYERYDNEGRMQFSGVDAVCANLRAAYDFFKISVSTWFNVVKAPVSISSPGYVGFLCSRQLKYESSRIIGSGCVNIYLEKREVFS